MKRKDACTQCIVKSYHQLFSIFQNQSWWNVPINPIHIDLFNFRYKSLLFITVFKRQHGESLDKTSLCSGFSTSGQIDMIHERDGGGVHHMPT